jgi:nucleoside-diphosphate-sugar epimerase
MFHKILVTGAKGQIGTDLIARLRTRYKEASILAIDLRPFDSTFELNVERISLDVLDKELFHKTTATFQPDLVIHLAALLSGTAEKKPNLAWSLNVDVLKDLFDFCLTLPKRPVLFCPSSIAVFGPSQDRKMVNQDVFLNPTSIYGITKVVGERLSDYYSHKGLDIRSIRFPGLISYSAHAGGGTTDFAVDIFHKAIEKQAYTSFLSADVALPMLYMPDALEAIIQLLEAPASNIRSRGSYNINGFSLSPRQVAEAIKQDFVPNLVVDYAPDFREQIALSWPESLADDEARADWGFAPKYDLQAVCRDMFNNLIANSLS